jgi:hypothetical protein
MQTISCKQYLHIFANQIGVNTNMGADDGRFPSAGAGAAGMINSLFGFDIQVFA